MIWKTKTNYESWEEYKNKIDFIEILQFQQTARKSFLGGRK